MTGKIDLHMHSAFSSDGEIAPDKLVAMASGAGYGCIAVTDHNRVDAIKPAIMAGLRAGVTVIPAIEADCDFGDVHLHVIGYGIDHTRPEFERLWQTVKTNELAASTTMLDKVEQLGIILDREAILGKAGDNPVIIEDVADVALADPRNNANPLLEPFRPGGKRSDNPLVNFYWDLCGPGTSAYVSVPSISLDECVALITGAGGIPVLAHPGQSLKTRPGSLPEIAARGVRGVEAFSSYHSPDECVHWNGEAKKLGLLVTCGSDFHGRTKPAIAIGQHGAAANEMEEILDALLENL